MRVATFYHELLQANARVALTEEVADHWFLLFRTHTIDFQEPFVDEPTATGACAWWIDQAAIVISDLWPQRDDPRADASHWLARWQPYATYTYVADLPPVLHAHVVQLRDTVLQDPRVAELSAVDERLMARHIPPRRAPAGQDAVLFHSRSQGRDLREREIPLRVQINDVDLFDFGDDPYLPVFLNDIGPRGMGCLHVAYTLGRAAVNLGEYGCHLILKRDGDDMLVYNTGNYAGARVAYDVLHTAWLQFALDIRTTFWAIDPDERTNPWWQLITDAPAVVPYFVESVTYDSWFDSVGSLSGSDGRAAPGMIDTVREHANDGSN